MQKEEELNNVNGVVSEETKTDQEKETENKKGFDYTLAIASGLVSSDYLLSCKIAGIYDLSLILIFAPLVISLLTPVVGGVVSGYKERIRRKREFAGMLQTLFSQTYISEEEAENILARQNNKQN